VRRRSGFLPDIPEEGVGAHRRALDGKVRTRNSIAGFSRSSSFSGCAERFKKCWKSRASPLVMRCTIQIRCFRRLIADCSFQVPLAIPRPAAWFPPPGAKLTR
jgi:hypothetical protein